MNPSQPPLSQYEDFMRHVFTHGVHKEDRTGTGTRSVFGSQMRFDLRQGFPLVTTKKVHLRSIIQELLWFLTGSSTRSARHLPPTNTFRASGLSRRPWQAGQR